jgi:hypothetical protein
MKPRDRCGLRVVGQHSDQARKLILRRITYGAGRVRSRSGLTEGLERLT